MAEGGVRRDEPEGSPRQGSLSSRLDLVHLENFSVETSTVMKWLGYGPEIRQARRDAYTAFGKRYTAYVRDTTGALMFITGSKAEGLSCHFESDLDIMIVFNGVICLEDGVYDRNFPRETTVLRSYSCMSYPGHCRLFLERRGTTVHYAIQGAFCDDGYGREILCSDLYVDNFAIFKVAGMVQHDRAGPSIPRTFNGGALKTDTVIGIRYYCPNILSNWAERNRHWPPPETVQKVVSLAALLTPAGFKGSEYRHVEWRVCFNAGEIELVNSLNDTQIKLYVLLKMVKNDVLNPRKKEVTSYMLKNIVLWIAENNRLSLFNERSLLHWLHEGLDALRVALVTRELPYYMIPDRNLMAACALDDEQQCTWISTISEMMNEGPRMIMRLPRIRKALIAHPEPFRWYNRRKIMLEMLALIHFSTDDFAGIYERAVIQHPTQILINMIVWEVASRMIMEGSRVKNLKDVGDRMLM